MACRASSMKDSSVCPAIVTCHQTMQQDPWILQAVAYDHVNQLEAVGRQMTQGEQEADRPT